MGLSPLPTFSKKKKLSQKPRLEPWLIQWEKTNRKHETWCKPYKQKETKTRAKKLTQIHSAKKAICGHQIEQAKPFKISHDFHPDGVQAKVGLFATPKFKGQQKKTRTLRVSSALS
jgi:hypothetical protein